MPLTAEQLAEMRRELTAITKAAGDTVTWNKDEVNAVLQAADTVLDGIVFDPNALTATRDTADPRVATVKAAVTGGVIPAELQFLVDDWLLENDAPPDKTVDAALLDTFVSDSRTAFNSAVSAMPNARRTDVVRIVIRKRVEAVL